MTELSPSIADDVEVCDVAELTRNGEQVDWTYWACRRVTPQQAARLAHCIDPIKWPGAIYARGPIPVALGHQMTALEQWLAERWGADSVPLTFLVRALGENAPFRMREVVQPALDADAALSAQYAAQDAEKNAEGRYSLYEAAEIIAREAGERMDRLIDSLEAATLKGILPVYEPGKRARYQPRHINGLYEEAYWNDLNAWLEREEPRIRWRFPDPGKSKPAASESPSSRRERLQRRKAELIQQNVKAWQQQLAREEGVSETRIRQLLTQTRDAAEDDDDEYGAGKALARLRASPSAKKGRRS